MVEFLTMYFICSVMKELNIYTKSISYNILIFLNESIIVDCRRKKNLVISMDDE